MAVVVGTKKVVLARSIFRYSFITIICLMVLFPLYWMVVTAIQPPDITLMYPPVLYPKDPNLEGFRQLFHDNPMAKWLLNSGLVALLATFITTSFSILGAYAISSFQFHVPVIGLLEFLNRRNSIKPQNTKNQTARKQEYKNLNIQAF